MRFLAASILLALLAIPLAGAAEPPIAAGPPVTFPDPTGDSGTAPDMTAVVISNDENGRLNFLIAIPSSVQLPSSARIFLVLDTDISQSTGDPDTNGGDYYFVIRGADRTYTLYHWNGAAWDPSDSSTATVSYAAGAHISIDRSQLGGTNEFAFYAKTRTDGDGAEDGRVDFVPDAGTATYVIPLQIPDPPPSVTLKRIAVTPTGTARAGKPYGVLVRAVLDINGDELAVAPSQLTCTATLGGLRVSTRVIQASRIATRCELRLPTSAAGKQLVLTLRGAVRATVEGASDNTTFRTTFSKTTRTKVR